MSDPMAFNPTGEAEAALAVGPPAEWLATQPFAERAAALASHAVGTVIAQGWLFAPVAAPGVMRWLFGINDTDVESGELRVSSPLGVVSVTTDGDVAVDWRWMADPAAAPDVSVPLADRPPVSDAMVALPPWQQAALDRELGALASAVAADTAEGRAPSDADRARLAELLAFVPRPEVLDKLVEVGAGPFDADAGTIPRIDAAAVPRSLALITPFESTVAMTEDEWRAAAAAAGVDVARVLGSDAIADADEEKVAHVRGLGEVMRPLGSPEWLVHVEGLAGPGSLDLTVAVTSSPPMWTAVCRGDAATSIGGPAAADTLIGLVRDMLGADTLGQEAPTHFALPGAALDLFAALADLWAERGDPAFAVEPGVLAEAVATPAVGSWSDAVSRLRPRRSPSGGVGAGNEAIRVGPSGLELHAQTRVFARRLGRPMAVVLVAVDDLSHPSGSPVTAGHVFVRTANRLWTLSPQEAWPTDAGVGDDTLVSLAALGPDDITAVLRTLLGA